MSCHTYTYVQLQFVPGPQALGRRGAGVAELTDRSVRFWRQFTLGPLMVRFRELYLVDLFSSRLSANFEKYDPDI